MISVPFIPVCESTPIAIPLVFAAWEERPIEIQSPILACAPFPIAIVFPDCPQEFSPIATTLPSSARAPEPIPTESAAWALALFPSATVLAPDAIDHADWIICWVDSEMLEDFHDDDNDDAYGDDG